MLSYVQGPQTAIRSDTIDQALDAAAVKFPENDAIVVRHQEVRLTWSELARQTRSLAASLRRLGLDPGDRVGVWSTNCLEWILLQLAVARARLVLVNLNPAYRLHEMKYALQHSGVRALFLWDSDHRANYRDILEQAAAVGSHSLEHIVYFGEDSWRRLFEPGDDFVLPPGDSSDVVDMQYTSGTTGSPKGVLLTHRNLLNNGNAIAACLRASERDRICVPVPMYHCFGCVMGTLTCVVSGAALILPAAQFNARATLQAIEAEKATAVYGVPAMFIAELEHPEFSSFDLSSLRTGIMAGAPCPIEVMRRVITDMHCPGITIAYGQTESSPVITMSQVDDPVEKRVETVGRVLPNTEVKVVSSTGSTVPVGEQGELCTRGYLVMKGYDNDPQATARAIDDEDWLHTGDLAVMRPDGYMKITGRAKDMIIRGGENISPRELEEFLHTHPKIAEVQVVGVPDLKLGEAIAAWVRLRSGETCTCDEIRDFCRGVIAHFKIPQYVRFVDEFPMTVSGKVKKFRMREVEIEERGLHAARNIQTA